MPQCKRLAKRKVDAFALLKQQRKCRLWFAYLPGHLLCKSAEICTNNNVCLCVCLCACVCVFVLELHDRRTHNDSLHWCCLRVESAHKSNTCKILCFPHTYPAPGHWPYTQDIMLAALTFYMSMCVCVFGFCVHCVLCASVNFVIFAHFLPVCARKVQQSQWQQQTTRQTI